MKTHLKSDQFSLHHTFLHFYALSSFSLSVESYNFSDFLALA